MRIRSRTVSAFLLPLVLSLPVMAQSPPASADAFSLSPQFGQSVQQAAADRTLCRNWSTHRSGYDPARAQGGVAADQSASRRDDYRRTLISCLEGRGYRVSDATSPVSAVSAKSAAKQPPLGCVSDTATRLPRRPGECPGVGSTYSSQDLDRTGQAFLQDSLRMLSPAVR